MASQQDTLSEEGIHDRIHDILYVATDLKTHR
jgi:hypothetical protein